MRGLWSGSTGAILLLGTIVGACAPAAPEPAQETGQESAVDTVFAADDSRQTNRWAEDSRDPGDPFFGFDLKSSAAPTTDEQEVTLRLRNDGIEDVLVFADGRAGEVMVDSVSAGSWTRVDLVTRAPVIILRSTDHGGRTLRRIEFTVGVDTLREVIVSAP